MMMMRSVTLLATTVAAVLLTDADAFTTQPSFGVPTTSRFATTLSMSDDDVLNKAIEMMSGGGADEFETPDMTQARIQTLVDQNSVLLFMKGSKSFPQCGFSDTATKILGSYEDNLDFHAVDVLADQAIREGVKLYSQWPTIPQLYVDGEFIGGSDIMIEMYENGELKELIEKVAASKKA